MALSILAQKISRYLRMYKKSASIYKKRVSGYFDHYYNGSWVEGGLNSTPRILPRVSHGLFKTGLLELIAAGY